MALQACQAGSPGDTKAPTGSTPRFGSYALVGSTNPCTPMRFIGGTSIPIRKSFIRTVTTFKDGSDVLLASLAGPPTGADDRAKIAAVTLLAPLTALAPGAAPAAASARTGILCSREVRKDSVAACLRQVPGTTVEMTISFSAVPDGDLVPAARPLFAYLDQTALNCHAVPPGQMAAVEAPPVFQTPLSGVDFPISIGTFHRGRVTSYAADGSDVSADYDTADQAAGIHATVYAYPPSTGPIAGPIAGPPDLKRAIERLFLAGEFEFRKAEIGQIHPTATLLAERDLTLAQSGRTVAGRTAVFEFTETYQGRLQALQSQLYVFGPLDDAWWIAYRFTYPKSVDPAPIAAFLAAWQWRRDGLQATVAPASARPVLQTAGLPVP